MPPFRGKSGSCSWFAAGPPFLPQWARDLDGQQAPRPRLSANRNRLLAVPRPRGLSGRNSSLSVCYAQRPVVVPDRMLPARALRSPSTSSWGAFPPQKYNADYDLSARQGADTLAFMSLLEEKLLPVLVSVPGPPRVCGQQGRAGDTHPDPSPHPSSLGAAWGSAAHPESGRGTG